MLATPVEKPFDRTGWLFEIKFDGYRAIAEVKDRGVRLYSRNQNPFEHRFPQVVDSLRQLGHYVILDWEIVVVDNRGPPDLSCSKTIKRPGKGDWFTSFSICFIWTAAICELFISYGVSKCSSGHYRSFLLSNLPSMSRIEA